MVDKGGKKKIKKPKPCSGKTQTMQWKKAFQQMGLTYLMSTYRRMKLDSYLSQ